MSYSYEYWVARAYNLMAQGRCGRTKHRYEDGKLVLCTNYLLWGQTCPEEYLHQRSCDCAIEEAHP